MARRRAWPPATSAGEGGAFCRFFTRTRTLAHSQSLVSSLTFFSFKLYFSCKKKKNFFPPPLCFRGILFFFPFLSPSLSWRVRVCVHRLFCRKLSALLALSLFSQHRGGITLPLSEVSSGPRARSLTQRRVTLISGKWLGGGGGSKRTS